MNGLVAITSVGDTGTGETPQTTETPPATETTTETGTADSSGSSGVPDPVEVGYDTISLPSGDLIIHYEMTVGDGLVAFALICAIMLFIAKWLWESIK